MILIITYTVQYAVQGTWKSLTINHINLITAFSRFFGIKFLLPPANLKRKKQNWFYFVRFVPPLNCRAKIKTRYQFLTYFRFGSVN